MVPWNTVGSVLLSVSLEPECHWRGDQTLRGRANMGRAAVTEDEMTWPGRGVVGMWVKGHHCPAKREPPSHLGGGCSTG